MSSARGIRRCEIKTTCWQLGNYFGWGGGNHAPFPSSRWDEYALAPGNWSATSTGALDLTNFNLSFFSRHRSLSPRCFSAAPGCQWRGNVHPKHTAPSLPPSRCGFFFLFFFFHLEVTKQGATNEFSSPFVCHSPRQLSFQAPWNAAITSQSCGSAMHMSLMTAALLSATSCEGWGKPKWQSKACHLKPQQKSTWEPKHISGRNQSEVTWHRKPNNGGKCGRGFDEGKARWVVFLSPGGATKRLTLWTHAIGAHLFLCKVCDSLCVSCSFVCSPRPQTNGYLEG